MARRALTHICKEVTESIPPLADSDVCIARILFQVRRTNTSAHLLPFFVRSSTALAMSRVIGKKHLFTHAAATSGRDTPVSMFSKKVALVNVNGIST